MDVTEIETSAIPIQIGNKRSKKHEKNREWLAKESGYAKARQRDIESDKSKEDIDYWVHTSNAKPIELVPWLIDAWKAYRYIKEKHDLSF